MIQRSDEWFKARLGKVTASSVYKIFVGGGKTREAYANELAKERVTGERIMFNPTPAMQRGTDTEPLARCQYEVLNNVWVIETGLVDHPKIKSLAASPDGLVGDDGLLEIKCPGTKQHLKTYETGEIKTCYMYQMMLQLACTDRKWCDFMSYDPRIENDTKIIRVYRNSKKESEMIAGIKEFLQLVSQKENEMRGVK